MRRILLLCMVLACVASAWAKYEISVEPYSVSGVLDSEVLWTYNHDPFEGKPYFHPLNTANGINFTDLRPKDHPWHRGLWFSWKYINGINYWEERGKTGLSDGRTVISSMDREVTVDNKVVFSFELQYATAGSDSPVLYEKRKLTVGPPGEDGSYIIDWSTEFSTAGLNVTFDRTPIPGEEGGKTSGGYAGLSLRMNKEVLNGAFLNSSGMTNTEANRKAGRWMVYNPPVPASVLILDHPDNLNYPVKWYTLEKMPFFSPVILHDEPYTLKQGSTLELRYRVVVSPKEIDQTAADTYHLDWLR